MRIPVLLLLLNCGVIAQSLPIVKPPPPADKELLIKVVVTKDNAEIYSTARDDKPMGRASRGTEFYVSSAVGYNGRLLIESSDDVVRWIAQDDVEINLYEPEPEPVVLVPVPANKQSVPESPWRHIGYTTAPRRDIYHRELFRRYGSVETWVKWVAKQPMKFAKAKTPVAYYLQYASADCDGRRISLTNSIFYDKNGRRVHVPFSSLIGSFHEPILPGSIGEVIWATLCDYQ
jgi:hypothetical protein